MDRQPVAEADEAAEDGLAGDPAVGASAVVPDEESGSLNCLDEVKVLVALDLASASEAYVEVSNRSLNSDAIRSAFHRRDVGVQPTLV